MNRRNFLTMSAATAIAAPALAQALTAAAAPEVAPSVSVIVQGPRVPAGFFVPKILYGCSDANTTTMLLDVATIAEVKRLVIDGIEVPSWWMTQESDRVHVTVCNEMLSSPIGSPGVIGWPIVLAWCQP
jgi:hypothetical protein